MTDYEKQVKHRLIDLERNQTWLMEEVRKATGMYCDSSLLHKLYAGKINVPKIKAAVDNILGLT